MSPWEEPGQPTVCYLHSNTVTKSQQLSINCMCNTMVSCAGCVPLCACAGVLRAYGCTVCLSTRAHSPRLSFKAIVSYTIDILSKCTILVRRTLFHMAYQLSKQRPLVDLKLPFLPGIVKRTFSSPVFSQWHYDTTSLCYCLLQMISFKLHNHEVRALPCPHYTHRA